MNGQTDYVNLRQARGALGKNHVTLRRMLADAGVPIYEDPGDRRVLLVRRADLDALTRPRPISRQQEGGQPSPTAA